MSSFYISGVQVNHIPALSSHVLHQAHKSYSSPGSWRDASCRNKTSNHASHKRFFLSHRRLPAKGTMYIPSLKGKNRDVKGKRDDALKGEED